MNVFSLLILAPALVFAEGDTQTRWEKTILQFEKQELQSPVGPGGIVFVGSSSIRLWDLAKAFPESKALNRGFGGAHASDVLFYLDRLVTKHRPRQVVFYAGDNDLAAGKSPQRVSDDVLEFVKRTRRALPQTSIVVLSIKPSPARQAIREKQDEANKLIGAGLPTDPNVQFVDVGKCLLADDGLPKGEYFLADRLHLNQAGYAEWNRIVKPLLRP